MGWVGHFWRKQPGVVYGCSAVPYGGTVHFLHLLHLASWVKKGSFLTAWAGPSLFLSVLVHTCMGEARLSGHNLESGVGHC